MSELFSAEVTRKEGKVLTMKVTIINPEQRTIYSQKNFALQLLWRFQDLSGGQDGHTWPLYVTVDQQKIMDKHWVFSNDYKFIENVKIIETHNSPVPQWVLDLPDDKWREFWKNESQLPYALLEIKVTDEKWIEHLLEGERWKTRAVDYDFT